MKKIVIVEEIKKEDGSIISNYRGEVLVEKEKVESTINAFKEMFKKEETFSSYKCLEVLKESFS